VALIPDSDTVENVFHLERLEWENAETLQVTQLSRCERLLNIDASRVRNALASEPDSPNTDFMNALLEPDFEVVEEGDTLLVQNDFVTYHVTSTSELPTEQLEQFYAYSKMNTCDKALNGASISPFSEYAFAEAMEARNLFPATVEFTLLFEDTTITLTSTYEVGFATPEEEALVIEAIHY
jgi:hypothetical protein